MDFKKSREKCPTETIENSKTEFTIEEYPRLYWWGIEQKKQRDRLGADEGKCRRSLTSNLQTNNIYTTENGMG